MTDGPSGSGHMGLESVVNLLIDASVRVQVDTLSAGSHRWIGIRLDYTGRNNHDASVQLNDWKMSEYADIHCPSW